MSAYRTTILFLGNWKTFLFVLAFTVIAITLGIQIPDVDFFGWLAVVSLLYFFVHVTLINGLSMAEERAIKDEEDKKKERYRQEIVAKNASYIDKYHKRIDAIYNEAIDNLPRDEVPDDDVVIILMEIHNRTLTEVTTNEE